MNIPKNRQKTIDRHIKEIKESEEFLRTLGATQIEHTAGEINTLINTGGIPKNLGRWFTKFLEEQNKRSLELKTFIVNNPHLTDQGVLTQEGMVEYAKKFFELGPLSVEATLKSYEDTAKSAQLFKLLLADKDSLITEELQDKFFKTLGRDEFGMSRLMADPLNNVPKMLDSFGAPEEVKKEQGFIVYMIESKCENSLGDTLRLSHRFRAKDMSEAKERAQLFIQQVTGKQKKVLQACWAMANSKSKRTFTCDLTDLMSIAYPTRIKESFSVSERVEFYQELIDLSETKLTVMRKNARPNRNKVKNPEWILPFITIFKTTDSLPDNTKQSEKYPNQISISVLHNPLYEAETMYSVGAAIKLSTLELRADDTLLAEWIQIRKSQAMKNAFIAFRNREELLKLANLNGTKHSGTANRALLQKFERLKEKGIVLDYPKRVVFPFAVKIREKNKKA